MHCINTKFIHKNNLKSTKIDNTVAKNSKNTNQLPHIQKLRLYAFSQCFRQKLFVCKTVYGQK